MAAGDSIISICNLGLVQGLGQAPISALTDNRKAAILCNISYDQVRREMLRAHPWSFARKRAQLATAVTAPLFGHRSAFTLPADYIRLVDVPEDFGRPRWQIEGQQLLCNSSAPLDLIYIFDCQDPTVFDPLFVAALGYAIAAALAVPLTQDKGLKSAMEQETEAKLDAARLVTSQDNSAEDLDVDILLRSRI